MPAIDLYKYIVPYVEMGGGAIGIMIAIWSAVVEFSWMGLAVYSLVALLFLFSFICGYLLYRGREAGIYLSIVLQIMQIPSLASRDFLYMFFSGIEFNWLLPLKAHATNLKGSMIAFYAGGSFQFRYGDFSINDMGFTDVAGINLFAFLCLILLLVRKPS